MGQERRRFFMACMSESASHCGLLMIPMMVFFGLTLALGISFAFDPTPIMIPIMLTLFVAFTTYYYFRGYLECSGCGSALKRGWKACPQCEKKIQAP